MIQPIQELFAWVVDDPTGTHGVLGFRMGDEVVQAVTSKRRIAEKMRPVAIDVGKITGLPVRLIRFAAAETLESVGG